MIELDDVFVLYPVLDRQVAALRGLSLAVGRGERVVITGPSGSGKSTLVRLVTGQVRPSAGSATVLDHDLANASSRAILALQRRGVGVITQQMVDNLATELDGLHNVAMQCRLAGHSRADAHDLAKTMLARLDVGHLADRSLATISAGEAQRVALAAALAHRPQVIVADEPTGTLDIENATIVFDLLAELADEMNAALLVVSHDPGAGRIGHRVLDIRDGRLGAEAIAGARESRLVVDNRGRLRLPEPDRARAGISGRAIVDAGDPSEQASIVLVAPTGEATLVDPAAVRRRWEPTGGEELVVIEAAGRSIDGTQILAPTTFAITSGELTVICGRSGSGKTTLLGLIADFAAPSTGRIERCRALSVAVGAASPGFAETLTVRENIELAASVRGRSVDAALGQEITDLLTELGLIELADRPLATLSGGERQRVSLVRALSGDADLILLDEPTSQLDQGLARRVAEFLVRHARPGRAIVCASHEPELISVADRVHELSARP